MRLLIVGSGAVITSDAGGRLADLAQKIGVAVATTPMGKGAIPDDDPCAAGVIGNYVGHLP
jgi:acetolactate synthase-1/2/3 large subunit